MSRTLAFQKRLNARPISFTTKMVKAIKSGIKSVTRRVITPQPARGFKSFGELQHDSKFGYGFHNGKRFWRPRYGKSGDWLWVQEAYEIHRVIHECQTIVVSWPADERIKLKRIKLNDAEWKKFKRRRRKLGKHPGRFMYRSLSRILLEIKNISVQRVQELTGSDARAEGLLIPVDRETKQVLWQISGPIFMDDINSKPLKEWLIGDMFRFQFALTWEEINGPRGYGWRENPWVWVVSFKRVK